MNVAFIGSAVAMLGASVAMFAAARAQADEKKRGMLHLSAGLFAASGAVFVVVALIPMGRS